jgi:signal transduction histidine kinase
MTTILLVASDQSWRQKLRRALPDASVLMAADTEAAIDQLCRLGIDVVLWANGDGTIAEDFTRSVREITHSCPVVVVSDSDEQKLAADFIVPTVHTPAQLSTVLSRALERHRLLEEVSSLRLQARARPNVEPESSLADATRLSSKLLNEFTRILAAGFDLSRTLVIFLDGVAELLRPARLGLLLRTGESKTYRVRAHRGLAPEIADAVRLPADGGLCHWLTVEGRPARAGDITDLQVARELALLQGVVAVPLLARGELVAVLIVGAPIVRNAYATHEIETLFDLATHLASAIQGISLHQRLQRASEFNEQILEHMSSGVVTIGADEKVGTFNRRAAEILQLEPGAIIGSDLRALPSPLGDMLYETLSTGRPKPRGELRLALRGLWLEVSTYPVRGETPGAVLVLEDLTAEKELAERKREAEQVELLTRVVARIADEIKNPLVSINTFMELIGERFDDPEFRRNFTGVVGRDVRRLVQVFEKLTGLVSGGEMNFTTLDIQAVIDDAVAAISAGDDGRPPVDVQVSREPAELLVKVDVTALRRAISYLIWYLGHHSPERAAVAVSVGRKSDGEGADDVRVVIASRTAAVPSRELDGLFDPVRMVKESVIDIGPAVSQRLVEALGGRLELRQGRHDVAFVLRLPLAV